MNEVTRREFVKAASAVTAVGATTLPAWAVQENRDPIKIG
ncbi:MAG: twin-arginine translocation signal domain-containing protein, partial [Phycisphaerae bacterium]|nr:twin-arginine translocation signal domain-containing protein [Phycisphaerae bacterium]